MCKEGTDALEWRGRTAEFFSAPINAGVHARRQKTGRSPKAGALSHRIWSPPSVMDCEQSSSFLRALRRALEERLKQKGHTWEWAEIIRGLDNLQGVEAVFQGKRFVLRSQVLGQAHKAFLEAGIALRAHP